MEGNKDEAMKCFIIGKEALASGNKSRAEKFVRKAKRLDPTLIVDDLLGAIDDQNSDDCVTNEYSSFSSRIDESSVRQRAPSCGSSSSNSSIAWTEEQASIVKEIKKKTDYYEILGLQRTCTVEDIRKAYRKLSLKVHPDKNKAPGAEESFKAVSRAFQCLSEEDARKRYDVSGTDEPVVERRGARNGYHGFNGFYEADVDAEEIFRNFFFGGGMAPTAQFGGFNFRTGVGDGIGASRSGGFNPRVLIQLLPVLIFILINLFPSSEPVYSLSQRYPYEYKFVTHRGVNFFVKNRNFEQKYLPGSRERELLDRQIEDDYLSVVSQNCRIELQRFNWGMTQRTPYCDMLKQFEGRA